MIEAIQICGCFGTLCRCIASVWCRYVFNRVGILEWCSLLFKHLAFSDFITVFFATYFFWEEVQCYEPMLWANTKLAPFTSRHWGLYFLWRRLLAAQELHLGDNRDGGMILCAKKTGPLNSWKGAYNWALEVLFAHFCSDYVNILHYP